MIAEITNYLRSTAHSLEEVAIDLMAKAKEIEELYAG